MKANDKNLVITRVLNAPKELVWEVWTDEKHIPNWWGPKGLHTIVKEHDFRVGGRWEYVMIDEKGNEYPAVGIFKEIVKYKKLTSTDDFTEEFRAKTNVDLPRVMLFSMLLEDEGGKTKLTLTYEHASAEDKQKHINMGVEQGWNSMLDKAEEYLKTKIAMRANLKTNNMARTVTYLNFPGTTEEAFNFYKSIFKTEFSGKGIQRLGEVPAHEGMPELSAEDKKLILHIELPIVGGHILMATDAPESMGFKLVTGNNMHISMEPESREETKRLFDALSAGGKVDMELQDMFFGAYFGSCTDKYGINWMVNFSTK